MKRLLLGFLVIPVVLSLTACFGSPNPAATTKAPKPTPSTSTSSLLAPVPKAKLKKDAHDAATSLKHIVAEPKKYFSTSAQTDIESSGHKLTEAFPPGSKLEPDEQAWNPLSDTQGAMDVTMVLADGSKVNYVALMVKEGDTWKFLQTIRTVPTPGANG
jgi:hypothetical protein